MTDTNSIIHDVSTFTLDLEDGKLVLRPLDLESKDWLETNRYRVSLVFSEYLQAHPKVPVSDLSQVAQTLMAMLRREWRGQLFNIFT